MSTPTLPHPRPLSRARLVTTATLLAALIGLGSPAHATLPCSFEDTSSAHSDGGWILAVPDGSGPTLAEVGATVEVQLVDCETLEPYVGYPAQDLYLDHDGSGTLAICPGGTIADGPTDAEGRTVFSGSLAAGGQVDTVLLVHAGGVPMGRHPLPIRVASPDLDGDLDVDLADIGLFSADFGQGGSFRADLDGNGLLNLSDVGIFARHVGASCP